MKLLRAAGFTLIEILSALAILGLIAVLGYRAVSSLTESQVVAAIGTLGENVQVKRVDETAASGACRVSRDV